MQVILIALGIYLLYRFIFGFLIPVINTTSQVKKQFSAMKEKMEEAYNQQAPRQQATANHGTHLGRTTSGKPGAKEDYIEYEDL
ncbi:MAG: hypothetical protein V4722_04630 [Bacteroidota bacterium]